MSEPIATKSQQHEFWTKLREYIESRQDKPFPHVMRFQEGKYQATFDDGSFFYFHDGKITQGTDRIRNHDPVKIAAGSDEMILEDLHDKSDSDDISHESKLEELR